LEAVVIEDGYLPENESVRVNAFETFLVLHPYQVFEGAYRLRGFDLDRKETAGFISKDQTVELQRARHVRRQRLKARDCQSTFNVQRSMTVVVQW
jgi:hypothetical protein